MLGPEEAGIRVPCIWGGRRAAPAPPVVPMEIGHELTLTKEKIMPDKSQVGESSDRKSGRGFAGMDPQRQRQIASEGGRAAHAQGTAHEFTPEEAREAGRKGGEASRAARARRSSHVTDSETKASPGARIGQTTDE